jgi:putative transposase
VKQRKAMIESDSTLSVRRQCQLLDVNRNRLAPAASRFTEEDAALCRLIDEIHLEDPAFGARKIRDVLRRHHGINTSRPRVARLMRHMGMEAVYRRPRTSLPGKGEEHRVHPYLLGSGVSGPDEAWCADITYIPIGRGFAYLVVVMDWHTRAVLSWKLSNTLDTAFCLEAFRDALLSTGRVPAICNTDQGCQFTSRAWRECLEGHGVRLSMDGKGRWVDNVFIERLWRSLKYEEVYLRDYRDLHDLERSLERWFERYNKWRPHQSHQGQTPWDLYRPELEKRAA